MVKPSESEELRALANVSSKLRARMKAKDLTVQELSDLSGVPKRSIENYLKSSGAQLPGVEAATKLARALGVSLDWLLLSEEYYVEHSARLVKLLSKAAALHYATMLLDLHRNGAEVLTAETIMGFSPEDWAKAIGKNAEERAVSLAQHGGAFEELRVGERVSYKD